ncbi:MAG: TonB-dependent receptor [Bacteroidota bacterium]|nr:TonB-dependent receptor [Bacteroidota bacterium]
MFVFLLLGAGSVAAQDARALNDVTITGRIVDDRGAPIEYANIVLHRLSDSTMAQGTVSDPQGRFAMGNVPVGRYYLAIHFIGYEDAYVHDINIRRDGGVNDLGDIRLTLTPIEMDEVEVAADRAPVVYELDKKVINVDRQLTATSGTAVDVLQNVPSVTVDLDGTVRLRGSGSFTVLIDGRPSALEGSDALAQIPSSMIENIEIITNPSARYNPEGMSGIINVIMKKDGNVGNSGVVNLGAGWDDKYNTDGLYTVRQPGWSIHFGADYRKRAMGGTERERSTFLNPAGTTTIEADGASHRQFGGWSLRTGGDVALGKNDRITASMRLGNYGHDHGASMDYSELLPGTAEVTRSISRGNSERSGAWMGADLEYRHDFAPGEHALVTQLSFRRREGDETSIDELLTTAGAVTSGRISTEDGPGRRIELKVDYSLPLGEKSKFVAGYEGRDGKSDDITSLAEFDPTTASYVPLPAFDRNTQYARFTQGMYSTVSTMYGKFGLQAGLRAEHTDRTVTTSSGEEFDFLQWDFFPTFHASYNLAPMQQVMASYTRRIEHSRGWFLEPFETWMDAYNVRRGNPALKPEYIDSWEAGFQTNLGAALFSAEAYHRVTNNKVEHVRSVYRDNITLRTVENVGQEFSTGVELMLNLDVLKVWDVYLLGNLFDYRIEGALGGQDFAEQRFTWNLRFNNTFKLMPGTMVQVNASYNSPSISAQGRVEGYAVTSLAVRQELFQRRLAVTLDISDVLGTAERESTFTGPDFSSYQYSLQDAPVVMLNLRWFINRAMNEKDQRGRNGGGQELGDDDF